MAHVTQHMFSSIYRLHWMAVSVAVFMLDTSRRAKDYVNMLSAHFSLSLVLFQYSSVVSNKYWPFILWVFIRKPLLLFHWMNGFKGLKVKSSSFVTCGLCVWPIGQVVYETVSRDLVKGINFRNGQLTLLTKKNFFAKNVLRLHRGHIQERVSFAIDSLVPKRVIFSLLGFLSANRLLIAFYVRKKSQEYSCP